jgi:DNA topoisomerase-2
VISDKFLKQILSSGVVDAIILQAQARLDAKLARKLKGTKKSRLLGVPKLEDANDAGTKNS